jgi:3-oxoacyl-[acyl-carrier-protein] synthase-1
MGIVSSIGSNAQEVLASLREGKSGISFAPDYAEHGFRSQVHGMPNVDIPELIDKRQLRFMGDGAAYNYISPCSRQSQTAGWKRTTSPTAHGPDHGLRRSVDEEPVPGAQDRHRKGSPKRMGPFMVTRGMSSTNSACLATPSRSRASTIRSPRPARPRCTASARAEQIQFGKQDVMFAGGGEELDWTLSCLFDAMGAMSSKYNDTPERASRAYRRDRDGFVIAGGGGVVVLEELEHAKARGAKIYAEVTGYAANSDGYDMVAPSGEGGERACGWRMETLGDRKVSYINAHGTSTPVGDVGEIEAVRACSATAAAASSTKSMTGHSLGATGVQEAIYCLLMLQNDFIAPREHHGTRPGPQAGRDRDRGSTTPVSIRC